MNVLIYTQAFWPHIGGIETFLEGLANHLHDAGANVVVVAENAHDGENPFPFRVHWQASKTVLHGLIAESDVLHLNVMGLGLRFRALLHGKKVVTTYHDVTPICPKGVKLRWDGPCNTSGPLICLRCMKKSGTSGRFKRLIRPAVKSIVSLFGHASVVPSPWAYERFPLFRRKCIPYFIDAGKFRPEPSPRVDGGRVEQPRVIFVGRLVEEKGVHVLIDAMRICRERGCDWELVICGGGDDADRLRRQIEEAGLEDRVEMRGPLEPAGVAAALRSADIAVVPSLWYETFGIVAGEAMATGLPVVATDAGGLEDVVGGIGLIVGRGDARGLAEAIESLVNDESRRKKMGEAGRRRVIDSYDVSQSLESYAALFAEVLGRG